LVQGRAWTDAALLIDEGPTGDAVLQDIGEDGGHLRLSIGFKAHPGRSIKSNSGPVPEITRQRALLCEIAVVAAAAFESSYTYARGTLAGLAQAFAATGWR
jgi:phage head maturation protease